MDARTAIIGVESVALSAATAKIFLCRRIQKDVEELKADVGKAKGIASAAYARALQRDKQAVQDVHHNVCDFCNSVVARFKVICANCEVK